MPSALSSADDEEMQSLRGWVVEEDERRLREALLRSPGLLDRRNRGQQTLLHWAVHNGSMGSVKTLLALGADRSVLDAHAMTARELALAMGLAELAGVLRRPPLPVLELAVSSFGPTSISLQWKDPIEPLRDDSFAPITEYCLECTCKEDPTAITIRITREESGDGALSYTFSNLSPAKSFFLRIWSSSPAGWSLPSPRLCFVTPGQAPSPPPQAELLKVTANGLLISW